MSIIDQPGIYDLTADEYHADPCVVPSFSRSIAKILIEASPAHARCKHPRLGGQADDDDVEPDIATAVEARDVGTAAHSVFLRSDESVVVRIPFDTYQTKVAKAARDEALAAGKVPLKQAKYDDMLRLVDVLERYRARTGAFTKGKPEQTLIWQEGPTWCRCMVDWLEDDPAAPIWDLKTTPGRADLDKWTRRCFDNGSHLQPVFYPRGAAELRDGVVPGGFNFIVVETTAPYGIKRFELSPQTYQLAATQLDYAIKIWERCMAENSWPGYADDPEWIDPPGYILRNWEWGMAERGQRAVGFSARDNAVDRMIETGNFGG